MPQWQGPGTTGKPGRLAARGPSSPPQIQRQGPRQLHLRAEAAPATDWKQTGKPGIFEVHENSGHSSVIFGKSKTNTTPLTTLLSSMLNAVFKEIFGYSRTACTVHQNISSLVLLSHSAREAITANLHLGFLNNLAPTPCDEALNVWIHWTLKAIPHFNFGSPKNKKQLQSVCLAK